MITIVTDSTAYLTHEEASRLGVVIVPMSYSFGAGPSINEGCIEEDDDRAEMQVAQQIDQAHTSQAPISVFLSTFSRIRRAGSDVLCITMSSRLSGTYSNAVLAARELGNKRIEVVDSLTTCAGLYLLICEAHCMIQNGEKLSSIAKQLNKLRHQVRLAFSVDDMAPLRRSGRLGNVRMSISTVLNIKPILEVREGAVVSAGIARGQIDRANKLRAFCRAACGKVVVDSFLGDEQASNLMIRLAGDDRELERRRTGPVLGVHLGKGCIGVAYIENC